MPHESSYPAVTRLQSESLPTWVGTLPFLRCQPACPRDFPPNPHKVWSGRTPRVCVSPATIELQTLPVEPTATPSAAVAQNVPATRLRATATTTKNRQRCPVISCP